MKPFHIGAGVASVAAGICCLALYASPAQAEFEADIYGGISLTDDANMFIKSTATGQTYAFQNVDHDMSGTVGGKFGYWFDGHSRSLGTFGLGLDIFHFRPDIGAQDVQRFDGQYGPGVTGGPFGSPLTGPPILVGQSIPTVDISTVGIGFDVLRYRLHLSKSEEFAKGRVQPYISAGPVLFISSVSNTTLTPTFGTPTGESDTDLSVGAKVSGGVKYHLTSALSMFGEFRYTYFKTEGTFQQAAGVEVSQSMYITSQHFVGGVALSF
jgi:opacity protein-like surface antigen